MKDETPYIYVFVRTDIPVAHQMVQTGHVCYMAGKLFDAQEDTFLVLCSVKDENELISIKSRLDLKGVKSTMFFEPDNNFNYTSLCTEPVTKEKRNIFSKYKLWC